MKKFLAIILVLVMALSLVACGGTPAQQPDSGNDANVEANDGANTDADVKAPVVRALTASRWRSPTLTARPSPPPSIRTKRRWAPPSAS